jgi:hypothetical protein
MDEDPRDARIAFLEKQLEGATTFLAQKDATEAECAARYQKLFEERTLEYQRFFQQGAKEIGAEVERIILLAKRYLLLRNHMVRCRHLDILARGEALDRALDAILSAKARAGEELIRRPGG